MNASVFTDARYGLCLDSIEKMIRQERSKEIRFEVVGDKANEWFDKTKEYEGRAFQVFGYASFYFEGLRVIIQEHKCESMASWFSMAQNTYNDIVADSSGRTKYNDTIHAIPFMEHPKVKAKVNLINPIESLKDFGKRFGLLLALFAKAIQNLEEIDEVFFNWLIREIEKFSGKVKGKWDKDLDPFWMILLSCAIQRAKIVRCDSCSEDQCSQKKCFSNAVKNACKADRWIQSYKRINEIGNTDGHSEEVKCWDSIAQFCNLLLERGEAICTDKSKPKNKCKEERHCPGCHKEEGCETKKCMNDPNECNAQALNTLQWAKEIIERTPRDMRGQ